jgi:hypothetical protein
LLNPLRRQVTSRATLAFFGLGAALLLMTRLAPTGLRSPPRAATQLAFDAGLPDAVASQGAR